MKKIILLAITSVLFASCAETLNDKAEKVIETDMEKTLVKPDTYKALETKTDSAFSPDDDPRLYSLLMQIASENINISRIEASISEITENMKNAETGMNVANKLKGNNYKENYNKYKQYYDECSKQLEIIKPELDKINNRVNNKLQEVKTELTKERSFTGYKAIHKYSAKNYDNKELNDSCYYLIDKDLNKVLISMPLVNYNLLKQILEEVKNDENKNNTDSIKK